METNTNKGSSKRGSMWLIQLSAITNLTNIVLIRPLGSTISNTSLSPDSTVPIYARKVTTIVNCTPEVSITHIIHKCTVCDIVYSGKLRTINFVVLWILLVP